MKSGKTAGILLFLCQSVVSRGQVELDFFEGFVTTRSSISSENECSLLAQRNAIETGELSFTSNISLLHCVGSPSLCQSMTENVVFLYLHLIPTWLRRGFPLISANGLRSPSDSFERLKQRKQWQQVSLEHLFLKDSHRGVDVQFK